jgi:hypothetical protein
MNLITINAIKKNLNDIENDIIIAEQTKDGLAYAKSIVKLHTLCGNILVNCNATFKLLEPILSVGQMQEIIKYEAFLRTNQND